MKQAHENKKKGLIVYFSQTGGCKKVAEAVKKGLCASGYEIDLWNLRDGAPQDLRPYGLIGFGSPVYYYRLPINVAYFLKGLPRLDGIAAFAYLVRGGHSFDAGNELRRLLVQRGARLVGYFETSGAAYHLGLLREGYLFAPGHPSPSELQDAESFGLTLAEHAGGKPYQSPPDAPKAPAIYRFQRFIMNRWLVHNIWSRLFRVDTLKCTACNKCVDHCPTRNISRDGRGHPHWGRQCIGCFGCESACPEEAITSAISRPVMRQLVRPIFVYNCRTWSKEAAADYIRVVHRRGKTAQIE